MVRYSKAGSHMTMHYLALRGKPVVLRAVVDDFLSAENAVAPGSKGAEGCK